MNPQNEKSMYERMLAGERYIAEGDPQIAEAGGRAQVLAHRFNTAVPGTPESRAAMEELFGAIGEGSEVRPPVQCDYGFQTTLGDRVFVNWGLTTLDVARVSIGDDVLIGPNVQLLTATHPVAAGPRRDKWEAAEPITIEDNVWLGGGVTVCPGVTIGANSVVGAGSVVTRDVPPNVVVVGNPARVVRTVSEDENPEEEPR